MFFRKHCFPCESPQDKPSQINTSLSGRHMLKERESKSEGEKERNEGVSSPHVKGLNMVLIWSYIQFFCHPLANVH